MGRKTAAVLLLCSLTVLPFAAQAQDVIVPVVVTPTGTAIVPGGVIVPQIATVTPGGEVLVPEVATVTPSAPIVVNEGLPVLVSARSDLELLANAGMGSGRPEGWSGSLDVTDPQLALLVRLDLELLAGATLGETVRPPDWFGAVNGTPYTIARDIRHDLELLADVLVQPGVRPPGWAGSDPLLRCNRATQAVVMLLEKNGITLTSDPTLPEFCHNIEIEGTRYLEGDLLQLGSSTGPTANADLPFPGREFNLIVTGAAVFYDRNARERAGTLPSSVSFTPLSRSTTQFSNMMIIEGDNFRVFVDYSYTNVTLAQFEALPSIDAVGSDVYCEADWCG